MLAAEPPNSRLHSLTTAASYCGGSVRAGSADSCGVHSGTGFKLRAYFWEEGSSQDEQGGSEDRANAAMTAWTRESRGSL